MGSAIDMYCAKQNKKNAKINYLTTKLFTEVSAMNAGNNQRISRGESMAYTDDDYFTVMKEYEEKMEEIENKQ